MYKLLTTLFFLGLSMVAIAQNLSIITIEHPENKPMLKTPANEVHFPLSTEDRALIAAMKEKLFALEGVGLAAPQVNYNKRIVAIYIPENAALLRDDILPYPMHVMINPHYEPTLNSKKLSDFEGCYSVETKAGKVPRFESIQLSYFDEQGFYHEQIATGFYARVIQHEIDHLNGTLITDRLTADCIQGSLAEMQALRRASLSPEKQVLYDKLIKIKEKK